MEHSTLILSVLYQFSGPFSGVPFLCFRIFTPVKLGHTWDSPFLIFPQDCAAPSLFLFNIQLQPCTGLFLLPSQNKNREKKEKKILPQMAFFSTPLRHGIYLRVSGESVDVSAPSTLFSSPGSQEACSGKSRSSPDWYTSCLSAPPSSSSYLASVLPVKAPAVPT